MCFYLKCWNKTSYKLISPFSGYWTRTSLQYCCFYACKMTLMYMPETSDWCCHKSSDRIICSCVTMMLLIIFFTFHPSSVHWALSTQSSDPGLWINIGYCFFPFKYRYVFFYFSSIVDRTLMLPYFVSPCCFCTSTLQTSVTLISVSLVPVTHVCGTGGRGVARVHVSPVHLAPLQHLGGIRPGSDGPAAVGNQMQMQSCVPGGAWQEMKIPHQPVRKDVCCWNCASRTHLSHLSSSLW